MKIIIISRGEHQDYLQVQDEVEITIRGWIDGSMELKIKDYNMDITVQATDFRIKKLP